MINPIARRVQLTAVMILVPVMALIGAVTPAHAQTERQLTRTVVILSGIGENLCLPYDGSDHDLGDDGEFFTYSGKLTTTTFEVADGAGGTHRRIVSRYQGVSGVGLVSGLTYHLTGVGLLIEFTTDDFAPLTQTQTGHGQFIVAGPGNNQVSAGSLHVTINANGELTSYSFESDPDTCR
jgi:hypothetical protein